MDNMERRQNEDAYSTKGEFQPQWETQERTMRLDAQVQREPIRASFPAQAAAVLDCRVYPDAQAFERTDDGVTVMYRCVRISSIPIPMARCRLRRSARRSAAIRR